MGLILFWQCDSGKITGVAQTGLDAYTRTFSTLRGVGYDNVSLLIRR